MAAEAQEALKLATEIPLEIAAFCLELGNFAVYAFDNAYKSARGDSGFALNSATSAVTSCLSIIELNLISLPVDERTEKIRQRKAQVKTAYQKLSSTANEKLLVLERESMENKAYQQSLSEFRRGNLAESISSYSDIEELARRLQNTLWLQRKKIWKKQNVESPLQVLNPGLVLEKVMEYTFLHLDTLGVHEQDGDLYEIAGLIDK